MISFTPSRLLRTRLTLLVTIVLVVLLLGACAGTARGTRSSVLKPDASVHSYNFV